MDQSFSAGAGRHDAASARMRGCTTCGAVWAPARAPSACPECRRPPAAMDIAQIRQLIWSRQEALRARYPGVPFRPRID
jgi:hypothetical protein